MRFWLRLGIGLLAVSNLFTGGWAVFDPAGWWESFPGFGHAWVRAFGAYSEHLVRDVGAFFLAFGVLFLLAAIYLEKRLAIASQVSWLFFAGPHLAYHMSEQGTLTDSDNLLSLEALAFQVALSILLLVLIARTDFRTREEREAQSWDEATMQTLREDPDQPLGAREERVAREET